jgi:hypothetical protein
LHHHHPHRIENNQQGEEKRLNGVSDSSSAETTARAAAAANLVNNQAIIRVNNIAKKIQSFEQQLKQLIDQFDARISFQQFTLNVNQLR